jgi:hypothetical protein
MKQTMIEMTDEQAQKFAKDVADVWTEWVREGTAERMYEHCKTRTLEEFKDNNKGQELFLELMEIAYDIGKIRVRREKDMLSKDAG